jgi:hypothetical protein
MSFEPLTDKAEIRQAVDLFRHRMMNGGQHLERQLNWRGGGDRFTVCWHAREQVWAVLLPEAPRRKGKGRYWCCFGNQNAEQIRRLTIIVEINSPHERPNGAYLGVFLRDPANRYCVAHTGKVGGASEGIEKTAFLASYQGERVTGHPLDSAALLVPAAR